MTHIKSLLVLFIFSLHPGLLFAQPTLRLDAHHGDLCLTIKNPLPQRIVFPNFRRTQAILILVIFENGKLIPDKFWKLGSKSYDFSSGYTLTINPNKIAPVSLGFQSIPGRFDLSKKGKYFVSCLLKTGGGGVNSIVRSNFIFVNIENKMMKECEDINQNELPLPVQQTFENELALLKNEENLASPFILQITK